MRRKTRYGAVVAVLPLRYLSEPIPVNRWKAEGGLTADEAAPETWPAAASVLMLLVTVAVIVLVTVAAGAPAGTTPGVRVNSLGLCTAGFGHFSLALGFKLGTSGTPVPRAGLFPKLACLPAASARATPPHGRHQKQD
jgi:hypothetical protein